MSPRKILQITSYPPPRAGWGVRVQFLKHHLEALGHRCVVLNIGSSRAIPSDEYETVLSGWDYVRKVWRYSRRGYVAHVHVNGASEKGFVLALLAEVLNLGCGRRCFLTFHAGIDQVYFPRPKSPMLLPVFWILFTIPRTIICNSEEVKAKIVEYGINQRKIVPIPAFSKQYLETSGGALPSDLERFYQRWPDIVFSYTKMRRMFHPETLIHGFARVAAGRPGAALVLCGIAGHMEPGLWPAVQAAIERHRLADRVMVVEDLPHEMFMTALGRARVYLRSHVSDGVCSSVLESLAMGVPVVAAENNNRPPGVRTYPADDPATLAVILNETLERRDEVAASLPAVHVRDTLAEEAQLLTL